MYRSSDDNILGEGFTERREDKVMLCNGLPKEEMKLEVRVFTFRRRCVRSEYPNAELYYIHKSIQVTIILSMMLYSHQLKDVVSDQLNDIITTQAIILRSR